MSGMLKKYLKSRDVITAIHSETLDNNMPKSTMLHAAKELGMLVGPSAICCETEFDEGILLDYAEYESWNNKPSAIIKYLQTASPKNPLEAELMKGIEYSGTSLFIVIEVDKWKSCLTLKNLYAQELNIPLMDVNLAKTIVPGLCLFSRLIPMRDFALTSGFVFAFSPKDTEYLLEKYELKKKAVSVAVRRRKRFVFFYKHHDISGISHNFRSPDHIAPTSKKRIT